MRRNLGLFSLVALVGCGLDAPRTGRFLSDGVGEAHFETRANGTDVVDVHVVYPSREDGTPLPGPHPALVYVQGGLVGLDRYQWQAEALARAGYVVALPDHPLDLSIFHIEYGEAARRLLASPPPRSLLEGLVEPSRIALGGHSLGGVVALKLLLRGDFRGAVVQAGVQDAADEASLAKQARPTLFLAGALDCQAKAADVAAAWQKLPSPTALVTLSGVTHHQFTGTDQPDRDRRCAPEASLDDAHARIAQATRAFLDAATSGSTVGEAALRLVPGAEVQVR